MRPDITSRFLRIAEDDDHNLVCWTLVATGLGLPDLMGDEDWAAEIGVRVDGNPSVAPMWLMRHGAMPPSDEIAAAQAGARAVLQHTLLSLGTAIETARNNLLCESRKRYKQFRGDDATSSGSEHEGGKR